MVNAQHLAPSLPVLVLTSINPYMCSHLGISATVLRADIYLVFSFFPASSVEADATTIIPVINHTLLPCHLHHHTYRSVRSGYRWVSPTQQGHPIPCSSPFPSTSLLERHSPSADPPAEESRPSPRFVADMHSSFAIIPKILSAEYTYQTLAKAQR